MHINFNYYAENEKLSTSVVVQIVKIKDIIRPPEWDKFNDVYVVYELMDTDLNQIIRSSQALTDDHCQVCIFLCLLQEAIAPTL